MTIDRLWEKVDRHGFFDCWVWTGSRTAKGYGQTHIGTTTWRVHRLAYTVLVGPIPNGLTLDHLCRNRACVNPAHLEPVDNRTNILRGESPSARHARQTTCIHGHDNWRLTARGKRRCLTCDREYESRRRMAQVA